MEGWIKTHRKIQDHWIYKEHRVFSNFEAWTDILLNVNHCEAKVFIKGTLFTVKRGESINSLETWAKRWNWTKSKVRRFLELLQSDGMVVIKNEHKTTRLTVCNYDSYQDTRNADETEMKRRRNADETRVKPNKNDKNENNENNIEERKQEFAQDMVEFSGKFNREMMVDFYEYWTEHGKNDKKMRFEKQASFDLGRRLKTWERNQKPEQDEHHDPLVEYVKKQLGDKYKS
jgi:hypothetical protein